MENGKMITPAHRYVFSDGVTRAVVTDWDWLRTHSYPELAALLETLNRKKAKDADK